jgi:hypothetical protein
MGSMTNTTAPNSKRPDPTDALPNTVKASASSLKTLQACPRRWYYEKIMGLRPPNKSEGALIRGSQLHASVEAYLRSEVDAIDDPLARLHQVMIDEIKAQRDMHVESFFKFERAGVTLRGFIDVYTDRGIWDHKTTSSITSYGEKPDTIAQNLQLNIYAHHWFTLYPHADFCRVGHLQYQTKGKAKAALVEADLTREGVAEYMRAVVDPLISLQKKVAQMPGPEYVQPVLARCWDYGGCPFKADCKPYIFREFRMLEVQTRSVVLFLNARPLNRAIESLEDLIAVVSTGASAPHPDLVGYGKGGAEYAYLIADHLADRDSAAKTVYVYARADDKTARALVVAIKAHERLHLHDVIEGVR